MINNSPSEHTLNWQAEADAIIRDVEEHVNYIGVSNKLKNSSYEIFLNLKTLENDDFCIRASGNGFRIVAEEFDKVNERDSDDEEEEEIFETPYALLNKISPSYVESFASSLAKQLENIDKDDEDSDKKETDSDKEVEK